MVQIWLFPFVSCSPKWTKGQLCPPLPIMLWLSWSCSMRWRHSHCSVVVVLLVLRGTVWVAGITGSSLELWVETWRRPSQNGVRVGEDVSGRSDCCIFFFFFLLFKYIMLRKWNHGVGHYFPFYFPPIHIISTLSTLSSHKCFPVFESY